MKYTIHFLQNGHDHFYAVEGLSYGGLIGFKNVGMSFFIHLFIHLFIYSFTYLFIFIYLKNSFIFIYLSSN